MAADGAKNDDMALGSIRERADEERVARYRRETGFSDSRERKVPVAFPAVWLASSEISEAIRRALAEEDAVPVHESQSFRYFAPLEVGESYDLAVTMRREQAPPRLVLNSSVTTPGGELRLQAETMLRIVPRPVAGGGAP